MFRTAAAVAFLASLVGPCRAAHWIEYRMGPYHVYSDAGDKAARDRLNEMEQLRWVLGTMLGKTGMGKNGLDTVWPIDVVLFSSQREYLAHASPKPIIDGGSARIVVWTADTPLPRDFLRALTRMLIDENSARMPESVEVALCDLFSTIKADGPKVKLGAPLPAGELTGDRLRAWAKIQMLATMPEYSGKIRVYLNNLQQNGEEAVAVRNAFDLTLPKLDMLVDAYVKAGSFTAANASGEPLNPNHDFPEKQTDDAVIKSLIAELDAKGANFPPESPRGYAAKNTRPALELAIKGNPKWSQPHFQLAALETNSIAKIKELQIAATLEPRNASYWQALAEAQAGANQYADAAKSWAAAEHAAANEAERSRIHIAKLALDAQRLDYDEAEKKRRAEEAARELERIKAASAAEVHAAEDAANARMNAGKKAYSKPVEWWDDPQGEKVEGKLVRVDCLTSSMTGSMRLTILKDSGGTARVAVRDLKKLTVHGADEAQFGCGPTKPARKIRLVYDATKSDAKLGTAGDVLVVEFP